MKRDTRGFLSLRYRPADGGRAAQSEDRSLEEPGGSQTAKEDRVVVAATMIQSGYGEREGQAPRVMDIEDPAGTQVAGGSKAAVVAAFMAQHSAGSHPGQPSRGMREPVSTLTAAGSQQGLVAASMLALRGTNKDGRDIRDPAATMMAGGNHAGLILAFLQHYYSNGKTDDDLHSPLGALTAKARHGLVTVKVRGIDYVITDIGMRMLEPEEGAAAHGFAPGSLPEWIEIDGKRRRLTKTEKYHLVGNSVPPFMVQMLAVALMTVIIPVAGALSDRYGRRPVLFAGMLGFTLLVYPLFAWVAGAPSIGNLLVMQLVLCSLIGISYGPAPTAVAEQFPTRVRSTGLALAYNVAVMLFGGFAPFIVAWLTKVGGTPVAPAWYVLAASLIGLFALAFLREGAPEALARRRARATLSATARSL